jgi:shikimate kinase
MFYHGFLSISDICWCRLHHQKETGLNDQASQTAETAETPPAVTPKQTIVLVGLMGAGKTTVGRRLARALNIDFVDADAEIEKAAGCTIPEIFEKFGEASFREGERKVISRLLDEAPKVLATGGGAFMNDETRAAVKAKGTSVWLDAEIPILLERVSRKNNRPLLKTGNPEEILTKLAAERNPVYAEADIRVLSNGGAHEIVVDKIIDALKAWWQ